MNLRNWRILTQNSFGVAVDQRIFRITLKKKPRSNPDKNKEIRKPETKKYF